MTDNSQNNKSLLIALWILGVGLGSAVFYHSMQLQYPQNSFLFLPGDRFNDFFNWTNIPAFPSVFFWAVPPLTLCMGFVLGLIKKLIGHNLAYVLYAITWMLFFVYSLRRVLYKSKGYFESFLLAALAYPIISCFDRGSVAAFVASIGLLALVAFQRKRYSVSAVLFAIVACLKITPIVFGFLFLSRANRRHFLIFIASVFMFTLFSALFIRVFIYSEYSFSLIRTGMASYFRTYAIESQGLAFGSSIYGCIKYLAFWISPGIQLNVFSIKLAKIYSYFVVIYTLILLGICWSERSSFFEKICVLSIWIVTCPHVMGDYYLTLLFLPLGLAIQLDESENNLVLVLLSLSIVPKAYFRLQSPYELVNLGTFLTPLLLVIAFVVICRRVLIRVAFRDSYVEITS